MKILQLESAHTVFKTTKNSREFVIEKKVR